MRKRASEFTPRIQMVLKAHRTLRASAARTSFQRTRRKIAGKPFCGALNHCLKRSRLREKMTGAGNDLQRFWAFQARQGLLVEFDHAIVRPAYDQQSRRPNLIQYITGEIGAPTARDDGTDAIAKPRRSNECSGSSSARAE